VKFKKNERHIVIRSYSYEVDDQLLIERFGSLDRFTEVLSHMSEAQWSDPQGDEPTSDELEHLFELTDGYATDSYDYWLTDDKGGAEISYEMN
jgi:hypothetical protein